MRPKQQAQGQFLIFQNENQFHFQAKLPEKKSWCFPANEWGCLRSRWRFCSCLRFADDSFPGGSRTCQDGTSPFSVWPPLSEGKVWRLPACLSTVRVFALTHTADYISDGCLGSKHDSANRRHYSSFVTFQMFPPPSPPRLGTLSHSVQFSNSQFPRRGLDLCYIGTRSRS